MRIDIRDIDMHLVFANYSDDGIYLNYALWLERLGLGRSEADLLHILKSSLKGLLDTEPYAQDNIVSYFETSSRREHRRPVMDMGQGFLSLMGDGKTPIPSSVLSSSLSNQGQGQMLTKGPVVDDFQGAMASLGTSIPHTLTLLPAPCQHYTIP